jgi:t-SNARE complex subunit (syntaxin)
VYPNKGKLRDLNYEIGFSQAIKYMDKRVELVEMLQKEKFSDVEKKLQEEKDKSESLEKQIELQEDAVNELNQKFDKLEDKLNKRLDVVGFSYEVSNLNSSAPPIPKLQIGQISSQKILMSGGYNWSEEFGRGYGRSYVYLNDEELR